MSVEVIVNGIDGRNTVKRTVEAPSTCAALAMVLGEMVAQEHRLTGERWLSALAFVRDTDWWRPETAEHAGEALTLE